MGKRTFINLGGNPVSLSKSTHSYVFGDVKPSPSVGRTKIVFLNHEFNIDIVSRDVPGLIGMDISDSKDQGRSIFHLDISERQLTVDGFKIQLGDRQSHLCLPDKLIRISPRNGKAKTFHNKVSQNNLNYFHDDHVPQTEGAREQDPHVGRGQLGNSPQPLSTSVSEWKYIMASAFKFKLLCQPALPINGRGSSQLGGN